MQQSILRQKVISNLHYGDKSTLVKLFLRMYASVFNYAVMRWIQIHGSLDTLRGVSLRFL